jgi:predicted SAM-dependent methyltransferase/acetyltransferase-like isoleucine patch superfamily enzyme
MTTIALTDAEILAARRLEWAARPRLREPLISVRIPTFNRARLLTERSIPSVLAQTYQNFEIVVVGECCTDDTAERVAGIGDPRIRFENMTERPDYPSDRRAFWQVAGVVAVNRALDGCTGDWIAPLDDDDEWTPDHLEVLLRKALDEDLEFVYGKMAKETGPGVWEDVGSWPLEFAKICHPSVLYSAVAGFMRYDVEAWKLDEPADWNMWRRMREAGLRIGFVDQVVGRHYAEGSHQAMASVKGHRALTQSVDGVKVAQTARIGDRGRVFTKAPAIIGEYVVIAEESSVVAGRNVAIGPHTTITGAGAAIIDDFVTIGPACHLVCGSENYFGGTLINATVPPIERAYQRADIKIERHVALEAGVIVHGGVTIGEGACVAAASVVTTDLLPWTVYAGSPAQPCGERHSEEILAAEARYLGVTADDGVANMGPIRLNVGCGQVLFKGWRNVDLEPPADVIHDITRGLPWPDGTVDCIYAEHFLEHLPVEDGLAFLRECRRALQPGGIVRIAVPDLANIIDPPGGEWREQEWLKQPEYGFIQTRAEMLNVSFHWWGHQYLYDREELLRRFHEAGFATARLCTWGESDYEPLRNRETRPDTLLIVEGVR